MTKMIGSYENVELLRKFLLFWLMTYVAVFLNDSLSKKSKFIVRKMKKNNNHFEKY